MYIGWKGFLQQLNKKHSLVHTGCQMIWGILSFVYT